MASNWRVKFLRTMLEDCLVSLPHSPTLLFSGMFVPKSSSIHGPFKKPCTTYSASEVEEGSIKLSLLLFPSVFAVRTCQWQPGGEDLEPIVTGSSQVRTKPEKADGPRLRRRPSRQAFPRQVGPQRSTGKLCFKKRKLVRDQLPPQTQTDLSDTSPKGS